MPILLAVKRTPVESSHIESIGHDETTETLVVKFKSGQVWAYTPVPVKTLNSLLNAPSVGKAFHAEVKKNEAITAERIE